MAAEFIMPKRIVSGEGGLSQAVAIIGSFGRKAFLVTDEAMVRMGNVRRVTDLLAGNGQEWAVFDRVNREPEDTMVAQGIAAYQEAACDFLIALGGGSPIDAAKAIGAMLTNAGSLADYMGKIIPNPLPPLVAIPTTAGTGSEATQFTIITDTRNQIKMLLKGPWLIPDLAVIDPKLTLTVPPGVTAATGIDALTHGIEAYTSRKAQPLSDTFALAAVRRIFAYLRRAYRRGDDPEARREMALAALEAGIAFNNASVTLVHGMSRPLGALFHVPHGVSNAMLLAPCLRFAIPGAAERFAWMAQVIGVRQPGMSDVDAALELVRAVVDLCADLKIPTLKGYGVAADAFFANLDKMAEDALASGSPANTRLRPEKMDIIAIYRSLWQ